MVGLGAEEVVGRKVAQRLADGTAEASGLRDESLEGVADSVRVLEAELVAQAQLLQILHQLQAAALRERVQRRRQLRTPPEVRILRTLHSAVRNQHVWSDFLLLLRCFNCNRIKNIHIKLFKIKVEIKICGDFETSWINWDFIKIYKQKTKMQNNLMVPMFYLKSGVEQLLLNYVKFDLNIFYHQSDQTSHLLLFNLQRHFFI
jgi:hypothetical protein